MNGKSERQTCALYLAALHYKLKILYCEAQSSRTRLSESRSILKPHCLFIVTAAAPDKPFVDSQMPPSLTKSTENQS